VTTIEELIADAAQVRLPAPRAPRMVIDLTVPAPRAALTIPDDAVVLVDGYADYGG